MVVSRESFVLKFCCDIIIIDARKEIRKCRVKWRVKGYEASRTTCKVYMVGEIAHGDNANTATTKIVGLIEQKIACAI